MALSDLEIQFDDNGVVIPSASDILTELNNQWNVAFGGNLNLDSSTPQGQLIATMAACIAQQKAELEYLINMFNPMTSKGVYQEYLGKIYFIERIAAQPTVVPCICRGRAGVVIPGLDTSTPAQVQDDSGNLYNCTNSVTIGTDGTATADFQCTVTGAVSCAAGTVNKIITVIAGWDTVENEESGVEGRDVESRSEFEARRYISVARNALSMLECVYAAVAEVDGVLSVNALQNRTGESVTQQGVTLLEHSAYICVEGGADYDIAYAIYRKLSAGCNMNGNTQVKVTDPNTGAVNTITFDRPTVKTVYVRATLNLTATTPSDIVTRVKEAVVQEFYGTFVRSDGSNSKRVGIGNNILSSRFYDPVINVGGNGVVVIQLSDDNTTWVYDLQYDGNILPSISTDDVTVVLNK